MANILKYEGNRGANSLSLYSVTQCFGAVGSGRAEYTVSVWRGRKITNSPVAYNLSQQTGYYRICIFVIWNTLYILLL